MTQTAALGTVPSDIGSAVRANFNAADVAVATLSEGAASPPTTYPHMQWRDDTAGRLYRRNPSNTGWLIEQFYRATVAPTANDDSADGWVIGGQWSDVTNKRVYVCTNNAVGAAVWTEIAVGGVSGVTSVQGRTGPVTITKDDVGLSAVTNGTQVLAALNYSLKNTPVTGDRLLIRDQTDGQPKMVDWSKLPSGGSGTSAIIQDEGVDLASTSPRINFTGPGVTAALGNDGRVDVTIPGVSSAVSSVNGMSGVVVLDKDDVGLSNVLNQQQVVSALTYDEKATPTSGDFLLIKDQIDGTPKLMNFSSLPTASLVIASQAEAEAGTDNSKAMSPLRVAQAHAAQAQGGGTASGTTIEIWDTDGASGVTDDRVVIRGSATRYRLPTASSAAQKEITVFNRAGSQVEIQAAQVLDIVNGSDYPDDSTNWNVRHVLSGNSSIGLTNKATINGFIKINGANQGWMLFDTAAGDNNTFYVRTSGDFAGSFATNIYLNCRVHDGTLRIDQRFVIQPNTLLHFAISFDLSVPVFKAAINGALVTPIPGGTLVAGTIGGTAPRIGSGVSGSRRAWFGLAAGIEVHPTYIDLGQAKNRAILYDGGPTKRGQKLNNISPTLVFNGSGTTVPNAGTSGGSWVNQTPAGTIAPTIGDFPGMMETIEGGGSVILPVGGAQTFSRSAAGGYWRVP